MQADHYFTIGNPHQRMGGPCEDYAFSTETGSHAIAAVCDGCGGAFANTDVGSRLLAHTFTGLALERTEQILSEGWLEPARQTLLERFMASRVTSDPADMYATLLGLVASPDSARVLVMGDGALCVRYRDDVHLMEFSWADNAPCYAAYLANQAEKQTFLNYLPEPQRESAFCIRQTLFRRAADGGLSMDGKQEDFICAEKAAPGVELVFNPRQDSIEAIALFSDGLFAMTGLGGPLPVEQLLGAFLGFKNFRGGFVKRRMLRALADLAKDGVVPGDDLSMACVVFGQEN